MVSSPLRPQIWTKTILSRFFHRFSCGCDTGCDNLRISGIVVILVQTKNDVFKTFSDCFVPKSVEYDFGLDDLPDFDKIEHLLLPLGKIQYEISKL